MDEKTKGIETILNSIGWGIAKYYNQSLFFGTKVFEAEGGLLFSSKPEAQYGIAKLDKVISAIDDLPPQLYELLRGIFRMGDWDTGRDLLQEFDTALNEARQIAKQEQEMLWKGRGRSIKHNARHIAYEIAEVYVLGNGKMPTIGKKPDSDQPSTDFTRAVSGIFSILGVSANYYDPSKEAVKTLHNNESEKLNELLSLRNRSGIISFYPRKK